jgi:hypothetical protein
LAITGVEDPMPVGVFALQRDTEIWIARHVTPTPSMEVSPKLKHPNESKSSRLTSSALDLRINRKSNNLKAGHYKFSRC